MLAVYISHTKSLLTCNLCNDFGHIPVPADRQWQQVRFRKTLGHIRWWNMCFVVVDCHNHRIVPLEDAD
jgi:hypothetical protein